MNNLTELESTGYNDNHCIIGRVGCGKTVFNRWIARLSIAKEKRCVVLTVDPEEWTELKNYIGGAVIDYKDVSAENFSENILIIDLSELVRRPIWEEEQTKRLIKLFDILSRTIKNNTVPCHYIIENEWSIFKNEDDYQTLLSFIHICHKSPIMTMSVSIGSGGLNDNAYVKKIIYNLEKILFMKSEYFQAEQMVQMGILSSEDVDIIAKLPRAAFAYYENNELLIAEFRLDAYDRTKLISD